jgi:hypothetical protein
LNDKGRKGKNKLNEYLNSTYATIIRIMEKEKKKAKERCQELSICEGKNLIEESTISHLNRRIEFVTTA